MGRTIYYPGVVVGKLTLIREVKDADQKYNRNFFCRCECGTFVTRNTVHFGENYCPYKKMCDTCAEPLLSELRSRLSKEAHAKRIAKRKDVLVKKPVGGGLTADPHPATIHALVHLNQFFTNPVLSDKECTDDQTPQGI